MALFEQNAGGAPANVLACLSKLGVSTGFIGKVGKDMQGDFLVSSLQEIGTSTENLIQTPDFFTTLAFVSLDEKGERNFAFARQYGADTQLDKDEISLEILEQTNILHVGSLSLTHEKSKEATFFALKTAKEKGITVSYDPNYRANLWNSEEFAIEEMRKPLEYVDMMKISLEESKLLTGFSEPEKAVEHLWKMGVPVVAVTLGENGSFVMVRGEIAEVKGFIPEKVVDTTGAGDSFWGGFLYQFIQSGKKYLKLLWKMPKNSQYLEMLWRAFVLKNLVL